MLELRKIKKDYVVGDSKVHALKGVDICFRQNEFVSILGPSGCGKTTLLNIIGGLDHYTDGDMFIDGISTKNYTDRDWDTYRNHRIGFVFQSYNLIPHQTILENVELALTISGVEKGERVRRAKEALDKVGLKDQYNKKPNQLSGGQCQRVAIARALVNEPEILLADEPTGALDTVTSVQIMDLIQEIAKECLVIMVTHNPELAEKYSTRIIRLLDGNVLSDSNPYEETKEEGKVVKKEKRISRKSKLSFWTAFKLSARNLRSKFKRTFMVCLAGSIGIIGVASVLGVSTGVQNYIYDMQNDMLSGNPIAISEETMDLNTLIGNSDGMLGADAIKKSVEDGYVNVDYVIDYLISRSDIMDSLRVKNDIDQNYVNYVKAMPEEYYAAIVSNYGLNMTNGLYTDFDFTGKEGARVSLSAALQTYTTMLEMTDYSQFTTYISMLGDSFMQAPDNAEFILQQYDIISDKGTSKIATESNEIMIVLDENSELSDLLLAQLGYYTQEEFFGIVEEAATDNESGVEWPKRFSYEELMGKTFTWYPNDTIFTKTTEPMQAAVNPFVYNAYASEDWENGVELKITAILKPKEGLSYGCMSSGFYYTQALAEEIIRVNLESEIVGYLNASSGEGEQTEEPSFNSMEYNGVPAGLTYQYSFTYEGVEYTKTGYVGTQSVMGKLLGSAGMTVPAYYTLTMRELGGYDIPNSIQIYPTDFDFKDEVMRYLDEWNSDKDIVINGTTLTSEDRAEIIVTDTLGLVIGLINNMINIVTIALVAFTALSLVVSTVMIAIITYVSVIERVKEIGVIRSLGGRKGDVSNLFNAETFIIGGVSGIIGVAITYGICGIVNLIVGSLVGIYTIATLPFGTALIMIAISIGLTLISGLIPARLAAKKDPVDALRSE